jgi:hypothetical protein
MAAFADSRHRSSLPQRIRLPHKKHQGEIKNLLDHVHLRHINSINLLHGRPEDLTPVMFFSYPVIWVLSDLLALTQTLGAQRGHPQFHIQIEKSSSAGTGC